MATTLCLISCALLAAQPESGAERLLVPHLSPGQELVYTGSCTEEFTGKGVKFARAYGLENRVFVLETATQGTDVALLTTLKLRGIPRPEHANGGPAPPQPCSVRLELARVNGQGRLLADAGLSLAVPLEGPATVECGAFVEMPRSPVGVGDTWHVAEAPLPPRTWRVVGTEVVGGTRCFRVEGVQQSDDWDHPRADRTAWRRLDTVWLAPGPGVAYRVQRVIERREPARREPTQRAVTSYDLQSSLVYPRQLFEDRVYDIRQARSFLLAAEPLLRDPGKYGPRPAEALLAKIAFHIDNHPDTPYREAMRQLQRRVEAARRGESSVLCTIAEPSPLGIAAAADQLAPDFLVTDLKTARTVRLSSLRGRPVLLIFFSPASSTVEEVLRFGQTVTEAYGTKVAVLGMAVSEDTSRVLKRWDDLKLTYPAFSGQGLRLTFGVDATPKLIVLDADGVLRGAFVGWGQEMPREITGELRRWLEPAGAAKGSGRE